jgi:hypothetical protein
LWIKIYLVNKTKILAKNFIWGKYPPACGPAVLRHPLLGGRLDKVVARPYIAMAAPTSDIGRCIFA